MIRLFNWQWMSCDDIYIISIMSEIYFNFNDVQIIHGNTIVKMAVTDTPSLSGTKLKQYYYKDDHYFEVDVDISSSRIAR